MRSGRSGCLAHSVRQPWKSVATTCPMFLQVLGVLSQEMRAKLVEADTVALLVHVFSPYIQCCLVLMA